MKKSLLIIAALTCFTAAGAQKLVIGEKAPDLKISEWLGDKPEDGNKPRLIEFFHPGSTQCAGRVEDIASLASKFKASLDVILVSKESAQSVRKVAGGSGAYFAAIDDGGKTFDSYAVRFVPFSVLVDRKGKILWFGNPASLSEDDIKRLIN